METKVTKIGKLHGGGMPAKSGPKHGEGAQAMFSGNNAKGTFATGPNKVAGDIGHKAKGSAGGGTKADEAGEDSAGKASGKRGNVKA